VARRIGNWGRTVASPLVGRLLQLSTAGVVMDGGTAGAKSWAG